MKKQITIALLVSLSFSSFASDKGVYGLDNRVDINDSRDASVKELGNSVAAMISKYSVTSRNSDTQTTEFSDSNLSRTLQVCKGERFAHQQAAANCTGFLVSPTHLVTAGHCVKTEEDCMRNYWVFDYKLESERDSSVGPIHNSAIYSCKNIVKSKLTILTRQDWAVIELDRAVKDRKPLKLSSSAPDKNTELLVIGTPSGIPLKAGSGKVRSKHFNYFKSNLDTFGGNSGSPVFNAKTKLVEGILVRGDRDYETHVNGTCFVPARFSDNGGRGEDVSYIKSVKTLLNL